jgi:uncharacterized protein YabE (DUF348 family)
MNTMRKIFGFSISIILILAGGLMVYLGSLRPVSLWVDGIPQIVWTRAITPEKVIHDAGLTIGLFDSVTPGNHGFLGWKAAVILERARSVRIWSASLSQAKKIESWMHIPGNWFAEAGIKLFPEDHLFWDGLPVLPGQVLPDAAGYDLQYKTAQAVRLNADGKEMIFESGAGTIGQALWDRGIQVGMGDDLSQPYNSQIDSGKNIVLRTAIPVIIQEGSQKFTGVSSARSIGQALAEVGISLAGLDFSQPGEKEAIPVDGKIKISRVREDVVTDQVAIPFKVEYVADDQTALDQRSIVDPGQLGVEVTRTRVRFENAKEVSRNIEAQWTATQPRTQKVGYGTKPVIRTLDTPSGPVKYWRAVNVYATAYSPCGLGDQPKCYYGTSSGLPVKKGVIAVTYRWYQLMAGQQVYVPGYGKGIIADVGGGIPGRFWIDLGFTDAELEEWHQYLTLYFLTPVPADIPWILP